MGRNWKASISKHWRFITPERVERTYKDYLLVVMPMYQAHYRDDDDDTETWKWVITQNGREVESGYESDCEEAIKTAEYAVKEITDAGL